MGEGLKKTGKIALYIITPTVILLLVLVFIWAYKKYKKKKAVDTKIVVDKKESTLSNVATKNDESSKANIERKSGVVKEMKKEETIEPVEKSENDDSKVIDDDNINKKSINNKK